MAILDAFDEDFVKQLEQKNRPCRARLLRDLQHTDFVFKP